MLASSMTRRRFGRDQCIFFQGDAPGPTFLLDDGIVELRTLAADGRAHTVTEIRAPDTFGDLTSLTGHRRTFTATAVVAGTAWEIPAAHLTTAIRRDGELAYSVLVTVIERVIQTDAKAALKACQSSLERVAAQLVELGAVSPDNLETLEVSQDALASMVGLTRETTSRALASLRRRSIIETRRRRIVIRDLGSLRRLADR